MQQETRNRIGNRQIVVAPIESRPDQSDCDACPHLEAVAVSKRIELEVWGLAQPLHLFEFFQHLSYLVHLYATGDSQLHPKLTNCDGAYRISPRTIAMHTPPQIGHFGPKNGHNRHHFFR
jgi:hypothetical protein